MQEMRLRPGTANEMRANNFIKDDDNHDIVELLRVAKHIHDLDGM
jgi:hypothetical protein